MLGSASTSPPTDGSFCEQIAVSAYQCYALPETIDDAVAAMIEPLSVALHAIRRANGVAGERVLVCGAGPIGLLTALAAKSFGAGLVAISEPAEARRDKAALLGIDLSFDPGTRDFANQARSQSDGGFDVVFEASGAAQAVQSAIHVARRGGRIIQIGTVGADKVDVSINNVMVRELSLLGTFRYADEFPSAIRLVSSGRLDISRLVTSTFSLRDISHALEVASQSNEALKVHILVEG
jgi:2-desacetyl-2-hydroxyethyl bacteriochlorophyllide A dehydrogenase